MCLRGRLRSPALPPPNICGPMPPFLYRCPNTGYRVQGFVAEDVSEDPESYEAVTCTAVSGSTLRIRHRARF